MAHESSAIVSVAEMKEGLESGLSDLPENCIAQILSLTTPRDVCRLAAVSQLFRRATNSESVWETMLPHNYRNILSRSLNPIAFASKKELYFLLCDSILIDAGTKRVWLERSTGKICYMLSARDLNIVWGDDPRYWRWVQRDDSGFEELAELLAVCWFEVTGRIDCRELSPKTAYSASFVVRFGDSFNAWAWRAAPVSFSVTTQYGDCQRSARFFAERGGESGVAGARSFWLRRIWPEERGGERPAGAGEDRNRITPFRIGNNGWKEFVAGNFAVGEGGEEVACIECRMYEVTGGHWKSGVFVDGVKIEPVRG